MNKALPQVHLMLSNPFPYDEVTNYDFGSFMLFDLKTEISYDGETAVVTRVFTEEAQDLLSNFKVNVQGKVSSIIILDAMYEAMTGEQMNLKHASLIFDFYFDNYEG